MAGRPTALDWVGEMARYTASDGHERAMVRQVHGRRMVFIVAPWPGKRTGVEALRRFLSGASPKGA